MIELMGVGVPRGRDGWLLRELCTTFEGGTLVVIGAPTREERLAVLDVAAARVIPREGRAWIDHHPLMRSTARTIRRLTSDVDPAASLREARSIGWNVMAPGVPRPSLRGLLRLPRPGRRQAAVDALASVGLLGRSNDPAFLLTAQERVRILLARALVHGPRHLLVRELDGAVAPHDTRQLLALLRTLSRRRGRLVLVTLAEPSLADSLADRVVRLRHGTRLRERDDAPPSRDELDRRLRMVRR